MADRPRLTRIRKPEHFLRWAVSRLDKYYPAEDKLLGSVCEAIAYAKWRQSKFLDALKFAEKAVALDPFAASRMLLLGLAHWSLANYDQAEQQLRRSFSRDPSNRVILEYMGMMLFYRGGAEL